jgi:hypothetical protein
VGKGVRNNVGKDHTAAGADRNLQRPEARGKTEGDGRGVVWRMSPLERRRELTPPEAAQDAAPDSVTPGPGEGALGAWRPLPRDASGLRAGLCAVRYVEASLWANRERAGVYASQRLSHSARGQAQRGQARVRTGLGKPDRPGS